MLWNRPCSSTFRQKTDDCASALSSADDQNRSVCLYVGVDGRREMNAIL